MGTIISFILHAILWLIVLFLVFSAITNIDIVFVVLANLIKKIKKSYEYIRQYFCKKSNEVNDDYRTVQNNTELFDSSSVWED